MAKTPTWESNVGTGATSFAGGQFVASAGGLGGTTGLYDSTTGVDWRAAAGTALKVGSACAAGVSTFASGTTAGGGAVAGAVLGGVADAFAGGLQAYDAQKCRARLQQLYEEAEWRSQNHFPGCDGELVEALGGCIAKQNIKFRTGVGKATIVGQPGVHAYRAGKAVYKGIKGTKGVGRRERAAYLVEKAKEEGTGGTIAREAVRSIMGMQFDQIATSAVAEAMKSS